MLGRNSARRRKYKINQLTESKFSLSKILLKTANDTFSTNQGVLGNDHIRVCSDITILEEETEEINQLEESKFNIVKISPKNLLRVNSVRCCHWEVFFMKGHSHSTKKQLKE